MTKLLVQLRRKAFQLQECKCFYCNLPMCEVNELQKFTALHGLMPKLASQLRCTADHLIARQDGGGDSRENIAAACTWCNRRHLNRSDNAPPFDKYRQRVQRRMAAGVWHPANGRFNMYSDLKTLPCPVKEPPHGRVDGGH